MQGDVSILVSNGSKSIYFHVACNLGHLKLNIYGASFLVYMCTVYEEHAIPTDPKIVL